MIEENYYLGFKRLCKLNKKIVVIPSKETLEKFGCKITSMCYLVDNADRQYNPSIIDPNIMESDLRDAFKQEFDITADASSPVEATKKALTEKVCDDCGDSKVLTAFRRKAGRGLNYHNVCLSCEASLKSKAVVKIPSAEIVNKPVKANTSPEKRQYLSIEKAKALILEAYDIGYKKAKEDMFSDDTVSVNKILEEAGLLDED